MTSPIPDALIAGYFRDGEWQFQLMQVVLVCWRASSSSPCTSDANESRRTRRCDPPPKPLPSSQSLKDLIRKLCDAKLDSQMMQVEHKLFVRFRKVPLLSCCLVDAGERFGKLEHWSRLIEETQAPHIVAYVSSEFWVVCAKGHLTHQVDTRSAISWLRDGAGLGFCVDEENGGVYRLEVSRRRFKDYDDDPWAEPLARLLSSVPVVFPRLTMRSETGASSAYSEPCVF